MKYRILFIVLLIGIFLIINSYPCFMFSISTVPLKIKNKIKAENINKILFLYGSGICATCPPGAAIQFLSNRKNVLYILPDTFTDNEQNNFIRTFSIKGFVGKGNPEIVRYFKKLMSCARADDWEKNYIIDIDENGRLKRLGKL